MSRSVFIASAALLAAAALLAVLFTRAERSASGAGGVPEEAPPIEAGGFELHPPPFVEPDDGTAELESAHELHASRRALPFEPVRAQPGETEVALAPELLASVTVKVVLPLGVPVSQQAWRRVDVALSRRDDSEPPARLTELGRTDVLRFPVPGVPVSSGTPNEHGACELPRVPIGVALELEIEHPFGPSWTAALEPLAAGEQREILAQLDAGVAISGRAVDEHGAPVQGARISVRSPRLWSGPVGISTISDVSGSFRFVALQRVDWLIDAQLQGFSSPKAQLVASSVGDVHGLVLSLARNDSIEGTVAWSDGRPAAWSSVSAWRGGRMSSSSIASDGTFRITLPSGTYDIVAEVKGPGFLGTSRAEGVLTGEAALTLVLERTATFAQRGLVVDSQDAPVERFTVRWRSADGTQTGARADGKGSFVVDLPAGQFAFEVQADGYSSLEQRVAISAARSEPLRFVLQPAGLVRGQVVDERGEPVPDAVVLADGRRASLSETDGRFELRPGAARLSLQATRSGYLASEPVELRVGSNAVVEGVILRLRDSGRVIGCVLDSDGRAAGYAFVMAMRGRELLSYAESDAGGRFALENLPPGPVQISASAKGDAQGSAEVEAQVTARGTSEVELRFD